MQRAHGDSVLQVSALVDQREWRNSAMVQQPHVATGSTSDAATPRQPRAYSTPGQMLGGGRASHSSIMAELMT